METQQVQVQVVFLVRFAYMTQQSKEEIRGLKTLEVDFSIFSIFGVKTLKNLEI